MPTGVSVVSKHRTLLLRRGKGSAVAVLRDFGGGDRGKTNVTE
jgi:hypothetical protein